MQIVTRDLISAKKLVAISPATVSYAKRRAHRQHRREWRQYLHQIAHGAPQDDAREIQLDSPRLTAWDIA